MTGIIKTDQLQGAQSSTIAVPSGNNLTVGGAFTSQGIDDNGNTTANIYNGGSAYSATFSYISGQFSYYTNS